MSGSSSMVKLNIDLSSSAMDFVGDMLPSFSLLSVVEVSSSWIAVAPG